MGNSVYNNSNIGYGASTDVEVSNGFSSVKIDGKPSIDFKIGGQYPNILCKPCEGSAYEISNLNSIDVSNFVEDKEYTIFADNTGNTFLGDVTVFIQPNEPQTHTIDSVWVNTSSYPLTVKVINENAWSTYNRKIFSIYGNPTISSEGIITYSDNENYVTTLDTSEWFSLNNWIMSFQAYCSFSLTEDIEFIKLGDSKNVLKYDYTSDRIYLEAYNDYGDIIYTYIDKIREKFSPGNININIEYLRGSGYKFSISRGNTKYISNNTNNSDILKHTHSLIKFLDSKAKVNLSTLLFKVNGIIKLNGSISSLIPLGKVKVGAGHIISYRTNFFNSQETTKPNNTRPATIIASYKEGNYFYNLYSDGWIEQGDKINTNSTGITTSFPFKMKNTNYNIELQGESTFATYSNKNISSVTISSSSDNNVNYVIKGYVQTILPHHIFSEAFDTPGTYSLPITNQGLYKIEIVAGGGQYNCHSTGAGDWDGGFAYWRGFGGGSGSAFVGDVYLTPATYTCIVGGKEEDSIFKLDNINIVQTYHGTWAEWRKDRGGLGGALPTLNDTYSFSDITVNKAGNNGTTWCGDWVRNYGGTGGASVYNGWGHGESGFERTTSEWKGGYIKISYLGE